MIQFSLFRSAVYYRLNLGTNIMILKDVIFDKSQKNEGLLFFCPNTTKRFLRDTQVGCNMT